MRLAAATAFAEQEAFEFCSGRVMHSFCPEPADPKTTITGCTGLGILRLDSSLLLPPCSLPASLPLASFYHIAELNVPERPLFTWDVRSQPIWASKGDRCDVLTLGPDERQEHHLSQPVRDGQETRSHRLGLRRLQRSITRRAPMDNVFVRVDLLVVSAHSGGGAPPSCFDWWRIVRLSDPLLRELAQDNHTEYLAAKKSLVG